MAAMACDFCSAPGMPYLTILVFAALRCAQTITDRQKNHARPSSTRNQGFGTRIRLIINNPTNTARIFRRVTPHDSTNSIRPPTLPLLLRPKHSPIIGELSRLPTPAVIRR
jgi:hypothetical protein